MNILRIRCKAGWPALLSMAMLALPIGSQALPQCPLPENASTDVIPPDCPQPPTPPPTPPTPPPTNPNPPPSCPQPEANKSGVATNLILPPGCPGDPNPPTPTPTAPTTPASIGYPGYTNGNSVTISWGSSSSTTSYPVYYLEENTGSSWVRVYQGSSRSYTLGGKAKSLQSYRVRACLGSNSSLCSSYRAGAKMAVNPMLGVDLYTKYPVLRTIDQRNSAYRSTAQGFRTVVPRAPVPGKSSGVAARGAGDQLFYLGDGYDVIRGALKENCLATDHPQFVVSKSPPLQPSTYDVSHVTSNRHLAQLLDVSDSAKGGLTYDDYTLGFSGEKQRYQNAITDETHEQFVVKWLQRSEYWRLNTPTDAIIPELTSMVLLPGSEEAKADFRERCGDKFINTANLGAAIYLIFTFDAKKYDYNERQSKSGTLGVAIEEIFNGNYAGSISTSTALLLQELNVKVHAEQVGGPVGLAATVNSSNFAAKYNEFVQASTNPANWSAVDFTTTNYQRPTVYAAYPASQIFADFTVPFAQARRWLDISVQRRERCDPYADHGRATPSECGTSDVELSIAVDLCRETRDWASCQHPSSYYTAFSSIPGTYLLGWLNSNVRAINAVETNQQYQHHVHKGSLTVNDNTCLTHSMCFTNKFRGSGPGLGMGFTPTVTYYDNPKGSGPQYSLVNSGQCANVQARLESGGFLGDTTADLNYLIKVEGFCADAEAFTVVP